METKKPGQGGVCGNLRHGRHLIRRAKVRLFKDAKGSSKELECIVTGDDGGFAFGGDYEDGSYKLQVEAFSKQLSRTIKVKDGCAEDADLEVDLGFAITFQTYTDKAGTCVATDHPVAGQVVLARLESSIGDQIECIRWSSPQAASILSSGKDAELMFQRSGEAYVEAVVTAKDGTEAIITADFQVGEANITKIDGSVSGHMRVTMHRTASEPTLDQALWVAIRDRTHAMSFHRYRDFIDRVLCREENEGLPEPLERGLKNLGAHLHGVGAYQVLKMATEVFLLLECGVRIDARHGGYEHKYDPREEQSRLGRCVTPEEMSRKLTEYLGNLGQLPYITRVVEAAFPEYEHAVSCCDRVITARINEPCLIELIGTYWPEEGGLFQTMNAITRRFQNLQNGDRDPLANMAIDPLRPINNLLWGYIRDEINRLTVKQRADEYRAEYGLPLHGKALPRINPAENRSKFLEAFHNLLYQSSVFFKEDYQTTVIADGFPLLNCLKEAHMILAQGAHNQFGDLPWTARVEMLMSQYILSQRAIRDFLPSRAMVPYKEAWMPQVDAMKTLQGWTDVTVTHFRDLGVFGEQLLLSIRYGDWINVNDEDSAKNWARYFKQDIQGYRHAYRAATGIDLTNPDTVDATLPAILLQKRQAAQERARAR